MARNAAAFALAALAGAAHADGAAWEASWWRLVERPHTVHGAERSPGSNVLQLSRRTASTPLFVARHRYDILDLPAPNGVEAATNGHVHRLAFGVQAAADRSFVRIEPTIAVSSNVGRHPKAFRASDIQLDAEVDYRLDGGGATSRWIGARVDAALGRTLPYPTLRWTHAAGATQWQLGFPESYWRRTLGAGASRWSLQVGVEPDGGQWQVRDRGLDHRSRVRLRTWRAGAALRWQPIESLAFELAAGRSFATELRYTLVDGTPVQVGVPNATFVAARIAGRW